MVPDYRVLLCLGFLMFRYMVAQEDIDNEVDYFQSFLETLPDDPVDDSFMMDEPVTESQEDPAVGVCEPNQICAALYYDYEGFFYQSRVPSCRQCMKDVEGSERQYGCRIHSLDGRLCRLLFRCRPVSQREFNSSHEERRQRWQSALPKQSEIVQGGTQTNGNQTNGETVYTLRHCPCFVSMTNCSANATSRIIVRNETMFRVPDDDTTVIVEPLE